ncbi:YraN family protein [uncultured Methylophaga sp.]|uniref:YraN family protein n=1 Tax=uncultured Methylophaga sp. TaxID=285271 RepID=UPI0026322019|nr:YraN family protein [uncultured Methylophaga sp.]
MLFSRDRGTQVEDAVSRFLKKQGLTLLTRNYHCRGGEIDLVMQDKSVLVFVEVRFRKNSRFGSAVETVNKRKQSRIILTARHYLQQHPGKHDSCRFDVVGVAPADKGYQFEWIQNAFEQS